ncbi:MAG: DMT family transporter [Hyphomicrobiales bacterium]
MSTEAQKQATTDRIGLGLAAMFVSVAVFAFMDMTAKWLTMAGYNPLQVVFMRYVIALLPLGILVLFIERAKFTTSRLKLIALRGALMAFTLTLFFWGLRDLPLAEAIAVVFTAPLFVTALSGPVLGEKVGPQRWAGVALGFIGMLIIVRPGSAAFQLPSLIILCSAFTFAFTVFLTRALTRTESNLVIYTYTTLSATIATAILQPLIWKTPELEHLPWFVMMGLVGGLSSYLIIVAYRNAPVAVVAPLDYIALLWGALYGWLIWREKPDSMVWLGAAIIVVSGLFITWRETRKIKPPPMQKSPAG